MKEVIAYDQQVFVFLNNLGSATYDDFWLWDSFDL
jgi:hypothetical protein